MTRIVFVTAIAPAAPDEDMPPLLAACERAGLVAEVRAWDDFTVSWARYDAAVLRSPWDYPLRHEAFLRWCDRVAGATRLLNPPEVIRWNTDKRYLADLEAAGVPVVPTRFVSPDAEPLPAVDEAFAAFPAAAEIVVKPTVSVGSRDTQRYRRDQGLAAANHVGTLLDAGRDVMLQPYLDTVDRHGEIALLYFDGELSHAIRKAGLLPPDGAGLDHTALPDAIVAHAPDADERRAGEAVLAALHARTGAPLPYARIDLIRDADGAPRLLELELAEPALFFDHAPGSADRFVAALRRRLTAPEPPP